VRSCYLSSSGRRVKELTRAVQKDLSKDEISMIYEEIKSKL
jgi:hypothetical protein